MKRRTRWPRPHRTEINAAGRLLALQWQLILCRPDGGSLVSLLSAYGSALARALGSSGLRIEFAPSNQPDAVENLPGNLIFTCLSSNGDWTTRVVDDQGRDRTLDERIWTRSEYHYPLRERLRLDSYAAGDDPRGPWQHHDPKRARIARLAFVAMISASILPTKPQTAEEKARYREIFYNQLRYPGQQFGSASKDGSFEPFVHYLPREPFPRDGEQWTPEMALEVIGYAERFRSLLRPLVVPLRIFQERPTGHRQHGVDSLAPLEMLVLYLCHPDGPYHMDQQEAGKSLGVRRSTIANTLMAAKKKMTRIERPGFLQQREQRERMKMLAKIMWIPPPEYQETWIEADEIPAGNGPRSGKNVPMKGGERMGKGRGQGSGGGWPSTTKNPSGGGRSNAPKGK